MAKQAKPVEQVDSVIVRFAGDSGDGMQLTGGRFTSETAVLGNDLSTLPDFPAEIRAPAGSPPGNRGGPGDRKGTRLNSSHTVNAYPVVSVEKKKNAKARV